MQNDWGDLTLDHSSWRKVLHNDKINFEQKCVGYEKLKIDICKSHDVNFAENFATEFNLLCNECGHVCF